MPVTRVAGHVVISEVHSGLVKVVLATGQLEVVGSGRSTSRECSAMVELDLMARATSLAACTHEGAYPLVPFPHLSPDGDWDVTRRRGRGGNRRSRGPVG